MGSPELQPDPQPSWLTYGPGTLWFFGVGWGETPLPHAVLLPERIILHGRQRACIPFESLPRYCPWTPAPSGPWNWGQKWILDLLDGVLSVRGKRKTLASRLRLSPGGPSSTLGKLLTGSLKFSPILDFCLSLRSIQQGPVGALRCLSGWSFSPSDSQCGHRTVHRHEARHVGLPAETRDLHSGSWGGCLEQHAGKGHLKRLSGARSVFNQLSFVTSRAPGKGEGDKCT